jgi:hypothetical protein
MSHHLQDKIKTSFPKGKSGIHPALYDRGVVVDTHGG